MRAVRRWVIMVCEKEGLGVIKVGKEEKNVMWGPEGHR